jgi:hypothetical protein
LRDRLITRSRDCVHAAGKFRTLRCLHQLLVQRLDQLQSPDAEQVALERGLDAGVTARQRQPEPGVRDFRVGRVGQAESRIE